MCGDRAVRREQPGAALGRGERERDRGRPRLRWRDKPRGLRKGLQSVRDHVFQRRQRGKLYRQLPKLLRASHGPCRRRDAQNGCKRTQSHA